MSDRREMKRPPQTDLPLWEAGLPVLREAPPGSANAQGAVLYGDFCIAGEQPQAHSGGYELTELLSEADGDDAYGDDGYGIEANQQDPAWYGEEPEALGVMGPGSGGGSEASADAQMLRERIIQQASEEAAEIVAQAQEQAVLIAQSAHRDALDAVAREQSAAFRAVMRTIHEDLSQQFQAKWHELEMEAAKLCVEFAENVIYRKIEEDETVVVDTVREGLRKMTDVKGIAVHISPGAVEVVEQARDTLAREIPTAISIQVMPDESVGPGGAVLRSAAGEVDLQIDRQIARLRQAAEAAIAMEKQREVE